MTDAPAFQFSFDPHGVIDEREDMDERKIAPGTLGTPSVPGAIFFVFHGFSAVQRMRRRQNNNAAALSAQVMG